MTSLGSVRIIEGKIGRVSSIEVGLGMSAKRGTPVEEDALPVVPRHLYPIYSM